MDPVFEANLKASAIQGHASKRECSRAAWRAREKDKLIEQRRHRGELLFLDRMEADARSKAVFAQVCTMRQHPEHRRRLNQAMEKCMYVPSPLTEPHIAQHSSKTGHTGQGSICEWAPLEYC
mmetsp:Transcript_60938/g.161830  ORF Transcript_60938/g.161830 Transcript_60938/m.161830 type:complete len:122 (-) Transcript_60938:96-461(-)